ncbi:MAG: hypothetical protein ACPG7F_02915 [Aggregatilineales bacterium]
MTAYIGWLIEDKLLYQIGVGVVSSVEYEKTGTTVIALTESIVTDAPAHIIIDMARVTKMPPLSSMNLPVDATSYSSSWVFLVHMNNPILKMLTAIAVQMMKMSLKVAKDYPTAYRSLQRLDTSLYSQPMPSLEDIHWIMCIEGDTITPITTLPEGVLHGSLSS